MSGVSGSTRGEMFSTQSSQNFSTVVRFLLNNSQSSAFSLRARRVGGSQINASIRGWPGKFLLAKLTGRRKRPRFATLRGNFRVRNWRTTLGIMDCSQTRSLRAFFLVTKAGNPSLPFCAPVPLDNPDRPTGKCQSDHMVDRLTD